MNALDSRKRAIMSVINNVKGFERSASGTSVTLEGCVDDDSIIDYKIYGNCYQDGEPSIENPIEVQCVGDLVTDKTDENYGKYKIPITASGKNLLNEADLLNTDNWTFSTSYDIGYFTLDLEEGKTYTIYCKQLKASGNWGIVLYRGTTAIRNLLQYSGVYSFTATSHHLEFYVGGTYGAYNSIPKLNEYLQLMIVEGSYTSATIGDYEPYYEPITTNIYLDEQLRGIDSYLDCVGYKNENVTREVWKMYFTDMSAIYMGEGYASAGNGFYNNGVCFPSGNPNNIYAMKIMTAGGGFCNKLPNHKGSYYIVTKESLRFGQGQRGIILYTSLDSKDKTEVFNHIGAEDCYAVYILNNSFETPITLPKLPTFKGTTIYTVGTSLQPANIEIKYYSNEKGE